MNSTANQTSATTSQTAGPRQRSRLATALWIVLALVIALVATGIYLPPHVHLSVPKLLAIWLGGAFLGYIGVRIGDGVRRIARPDVIVTTGGVSDALWARICWGIGPQIAGLYLGAVTGTSILVGWLA
ncbi:hypothetical protein EN871_09930 [bacterium M00.F.Ca.ET.228.01.1.1]|nr:hypothetical protein EN871_09930 [bacterium M00.F.Ca.ET.228.01.1.1]TGS02773.1 hypothetical protein EN834_09925 [bacterium M00.F.Ca.ET.191.01.1.1]TGU06155.1 hypothetical protein EN798_14005 [bacterium M00.F.Ca.ET.155.01.1.1]